MGLFKKNVRLQTITPTPNKNKPEPVEMTAEEEDDVLEEDFDAILDDQQEGNDNVSNDAPTPEEDTEDIDKQILEHFEYAVSLVVQKLLNGDNNVSEKDE